MAQIWSLVAMMCFVLVLTWMMVIVDMVQANNDIWNETLFIRWMQKYGKDKLYGGNPAIKSKRFKIFKDNLQYMLNHNNISSSPYKLGLNSFSDITFDEALASFLKEREVGDYNQTYSPQPDSVTFCNSPRLPRNFDWRSRGVVTPVKTQGQCGSSWAFAAVATIESAYAIKKGPLYRLSEQELVSCDTRYSRGCQGGNKAYALKWVVHNRGIDSEVDYPYISGSTGNQGTCNISKVTTRKVARIRRVVSVPMANEAALKCAVHKQPVAVSIYANNDFLQYSSGIFDAGRKSCPYKAGTSNHAVTLVGWGKTTSGVKYWIVKNSWGPYWGDHGYAYLKRGKIFPQGVCGVNNYPVYPIA